MDWTLVIATFFVSFLIGFCCGGFGPIIRSVKKMLQRKG